MDDTTPSVPRRWKLEEGSADARDSFVRLEAVRDGRAVEMSIHGVMDTDSSGPIARQIFHALELPVASLSLNLAEVLFIDSSGLGVLNSARTRALQRRIVLTLEAVPDPVRRVLDLSGMLTLFAIDGAPPREDDGQS